MGQMLSAPVTDKTTTSGQNARLKFGASSMQGWRVSMEDAHTTEVEVDGHKDVSFFAVFDGHGGQTIAQYAGRNAHHRVLSDVEFSRGNYAQALRNAFLGIDEDLRRHPDHANDRSGCTAVTLLVTKDNRLFCANAGDSRCVLSRRGAAIPLSFDHKPDNEVEEARIVRAGGYIYGGRVNGNLALSRAIGDFAFKTNPTLPAEEQMVTVNPDVIEETIGEDDEFVILACDGIWDCMTNQQAVNFVRARIAEGVPLGAICEQMMDRCLAPSGEGGLGAGSDNMTVVIVGLLMSGSDEALRAKCGLPARAPYAEEVTGQSESGTPPPNEPGQRRIFYATASGRSTTTTTTTVNGREVSYTEEREVEGSVETPPPRSAEPIRIPARRALELLLGFNLGGGRTSGPADAAQEEMEEDDDSVQMDATPPASEADRQGGDDLR